MSLKIFDDLFLSKIYADMPMGICAADPMSELRTIEAL